MGASFRFIHAADLHLDSPFRGLAKAPDAVRLALAGATFSALRRLTDTAIAEEADFIVIAGDLFDEADRSLRAQLALVKEWERLAGHGIAVYVIHGNHDHLGGRRAKLALPPSVHIFGAREVSWKPAYNRSGELAAHVYGISYGERAVAANLAAGYRKAEEAPYHIALLHGNVGGDPSHDPYAPCSLEELKTAGFDYWALGHIHQRKVLHSYPHVVYAGNTQGRNPRETGAKGCYIADVSASGATSLRFAALDSVRWEEAELSIEGAETEQQLLRKMTEAAASIAAGNEERSVMLRLRLTGRGSLHARLSDPAVAAALLESLQEELEPAAGAVWVHVYGLEAATGADIDWAALAEEDSFAGELYRTGRSLERSGEEWRGFARAALADVRSHAKLGKLGRALWDELPPRLAKSGCELAAGLIAGGERSDERD